MNQDEVVLSDKSWQRKLFPLFPHQFFGAPMPYHMAWLAPLLLSQLGASALLIGIITAGYGVIGLSLAFFGRISDRLNTRFGRRKPFLFFGDLLSIITLVALSYVIGQTWGPTAMLWSSILVLLVFYFGSRLVGPALFALSMPDLFPAEQRGRVSGAIEAVAVAGAVVTGLYIAFALGEDNYSGVLLLLGLFGVPALLTGVFAWEPPVLSSAEGATDSITSRPARDIAEQRYGLAELRHAFTTVRAYPQVVRFLIFSTILFLGYTLMFGLISLYLERALGFTPGEIGYIVVAFLALEMLLSLPWGWAADRFGKRRVLHVALGAAIVSYFLIAIVRTPFQLFLILPLVAAADIGIFIVPRAVLSELAPREHSANFFGLFILTFILATIVAPPIAGIIMDSIGPRWLPVVGGLVLIAALPFLRSVESRLPKSS